MNTKETNIQRSISEKILTYTSFFLLGMQFLFLIYANLKLIPETLDNDVAKLFLHIIKMWEHKTLFVPDWQNMTTLEIDCASLFALPLYGITKNIYLSYGLANLIFSIIFLLISWSLLEKMKVSGAGKALGCALIITPLSFGQLFYYNMMFFAGGQYVVKVLIPLLLIWLLTTGREEYKVLWYVAAVSEVFLAFLNGLSSAAFVAGAGLMPVILVYLWVDFSKKNRLKDWIREEKLWLCALVFVSSASGIVCGHIKQTCESGSNLYLTSLSNINQAVEDWGVSLIESFGALPYGELSILSLSGITHVLKLFLLFCFLSALFFEAGKVIKNLNDLSSHSECIRAYIVFLFIWNSFVVIIGSYGGVCRYMFLSIVPALLLIPGWFEHLLSRIKDIGIRRISVKIVFAGMLFALMATSDYSVKIGNCRPEKKHELEQFDGILSIIKEQPEKFIAFYNNLGISEVMRLLDYGSEREYQTITDTGAVEVHGWYGGRAERALLPDQYLLVIDETNNSFDDIPSYIREHLEPVETFQVYSVYRSNYNRFDEISGYFDTLDAIDYCTSPGYVIYQGEINADGCLQVTGTGDYVLGSPSLRGNGGTVDITMHHSSVNGSGEIGVMEIWSSTTHEMISSVAILPNTESTGIHMPDNRDLVIKVRIQEGCEIAVDSFEYHSES